MSGQSIQADMAQPAISSPLASRTNPTPRPSYSLSSIATFLRQLVCPPAVLKPCLYSKATLEQRQGRTSELKENQRIYIYKSPPTIPGVAFVEGPPQELPGQMPSHRWIISVSIAALKVLLNFVRHKPALIARAIRTVTEFILFDKCQETSLQSIIEAYKNRVDADDLAQVVSHRFKNAHVGSQFEERNPILEPYRDMWWLMALPEIGNIFLEDKAFARLRVAGFNPTSLVRVFSVNDMSFLVADENMPWGGDSIVACIAENRLYAQDFSFMDALPQKANSKNIFAVTSAIYAIPPGGGDLEPVAIQVNGDVFFPPKRNRPFTTHWAIAKMALNQNDATHQELFAHLGRTHLLVEPFVIATMRQLPSDHPVHILLKPHFEGTIFINDTASKNLVKVGGEVDRIFAGDITSVMKLCASLVISNHFNDSMPDVELKKRGLMDRILNMPYRDDALEHFRAMYRFVHLYVSHFYKTDDGVMQDPELQAWVQELLDPECGRLKGFGEDDKGTVSSIKYLARALTFVIFSASVQHAAVNFPQFDYMAYAPAISGGLYAVPPKPSEEAGLEHWAAMLTPIKTAIEQIRILGLIGAVYHTRLGHYRRGEMPDDEPVQTALREYQDELLRIDTRIEKRERNSRLKYDFLRSSKIPQSINI